MMIAAKEDWWAGFYDDLLADMLLERTAEEGIRQTADFLEKVLLLKPGARVFDQCCGSGRLSLALAARGYALTGVDLAAGYIQRAREKAQGLSAEFFQGDAFEFTTSCDAAFNWWTSFGYATDDERNLEMLQRVWESLRPGGRLALDFMNVPGLYRHFQPSTVTRGGEVLLIRESALDLACGLILKHWTYLLPGGRRVEHDTQVRLYDPPTLQRLFTAAGLTEIVFFGDTDGSPLSLESPRCIVVARRP